MFRWKAIREGLRSLLRRERIDREVDEEIQHYLDLAATEFEARGFSPDEARRAARLQAGSPVTAREDVRGAGWESPLAGSLDDLRHALRRLAHRPAFTLGAIATLAIGTGATSTVFSVVDAVLLRPLPYPASDRLVALRHSASGAGLRELRMSPSLYFTYREESRVLEDVAIWNGGKATVTGIGDPEELPTLFVTDTFLNVLRVQPAVGRGFTARDGKPGSPPTVLVSDGLWRRWFAADPGALGRSLTIDGRPHELIGVLAPSFEFLDEKIALIVPRQFRRADIRLIQFSEDGVARLRPGVTLQQANADIARCLPLAASKFPLNAGFAANAFTDARIAPRLRFLKDDFVGDAAGSLWVVMGGAALLLAIAGANLAGLLLVRADARRHELAVRAALGASSIRLVRDVLCESLLLSTGAALLGSAICFAALQLIGRMPIAGLTRLDASAFSASSVVFAFAVSLFTGIICAVWPVRALAWTSGVLRTAGDRWSSMSRERRRTQFALVAGQTALAIVLLVAAGLMLRTFHALHVVDPGFASPERVQAVRVSIPPSQLREPEGVMRLQEAILRSFTQVAQGSAGAMSNAIPLEGGAGAPIYVAGRDHGDTKLPPVRRIFNVSPGYPAAIGARLAAGRDFTWTELYRFAPVAMISENMAREFWGSAPGAIGQRIRATLNHDWAEIVGVVADVYDDGPGRPSPATVYWPILQKNASGVPGVTRNVEILIRTNRAGTAQLTEDLQRALRTLNPNLPLANVRTLGSVYRRSMSRTSFALVLLGTAGVLALLLGVIGMYAVIAYSVAQRRRDIGIRIALGSSAERVSGLFVKQALLLVGTGAAVGVPAAMAGTQLMRSMLFGVSATDPVTYAAVTFILLLAAVTAAWLPARAASRVDPVEALRGE